MQTAALQISFTVPVIQTERLVLRDPRETDFPAMLAFNDSPRSAFVGGPVERRWLWRGLLANIGHWALRGYGFYSVDTHDGSFVGRVGVIYHDGWPEPELAWHLFDGHEGKGYAHEAALAARADYHARISARPLISMIDVANARSEALAQRLGAVLERTQTDPDGDYHIYRHPAPGGQA
jgi:RimJ/RimL family protein N-acetyltransferase